ncbi:MAG: hypothetical protein ACR2KG_08125 [Nocardioidaceae bacterium]
MRLRTVSPHDVGWTRRRAGKGFVYGVTIAAARNRAPRQPDRRQEHLEKAVLQMLMKAG